MIAVINLLFVVFLSVILASCSDTERKNQSGSIDWSETEIVQYWRRQAQLCNVPGRSISFPTKEETGEQPCDDGDMTLFNGFLCVADVQVGCSGVKDAQDLSTGEWFRSPRIRWLPVGQGGVRNDRGHAEFSPDMAVGVQLYLLKTKDVAAAEQWLLFLHSLTCEKSRDCLETPVFCRQDGCGIRPWDAATLSQTVRYLQANHGLPELPDGSLKAMLDDQHDRFAVLLYAQSKINKKGYSHNLVAGQILIAQLVGLADPHIYASAKVIADAPVNQDNAFFTYLAYGYGARFKEELFKICPAPDATLKHPLDQWIWERDYSDQAWEQTCFWDCLFAYELRNKALNVPVTSPIPPCLIDGVVPDDRPVLSAGPLEELSEWKPVSELDFKTTGSITRGSRNAYSHHWSDAFMITKNTTSGACQNIAFVQLRYPTSQDGWKFKLGECEPLPVKERTDYAVDSTGSGFVRSKGRILSSSFGFLQDKIAAPDDGSWSMLYVFEHNGEASLAVYNIKHQEHFFHTLENGNWVTRKFGSAPPFCFPAVIALRNSAFVKCNGLGNNHITDNYKDWRVDTSGPLSSIPFFKVIHGPFDINGSKAPDRAIVISPSAKGLIYVKDDLTPISVPIPGPDQLVFDAVWLTPLEVLAITEATVVKLDIGTGNGSYKTKPLSRCSIILNRESSKAHGQCLLPSGRGIGSFIEIDVNTLSLKDVTKEVGLRP